MDRIIQMIIRVVILELVRRGTSFAINRFSRQGQGNNPDLDQNGNQGNNAPQIDQRELKQRMRLMRRRF